MYFKGRLSIDPSQLTKIDKVSPESGFKKMLFSLTGGQFADKKEIETFKALNILQQIHGVFSSNGIDNIIRLTHDDIDIYHDTKGEKNVKVNSFQKTYHHLGCIFVLRCFCCQFCKCR